MAKPLTIDVVSDVVCPWCFIGKKRLEKAIALRPDLDVEVRWHPYFLNDWVPREGISRDEYLTKKFGSPERYKGIASRGGTPLPFWYISREVGAPTNRWDNPTVMRQQTVNGRMWPVKGPQLLVALPHFKT